MMKEFISWTIYDHPNNFPNNYVARKYIKGNPTDEFMIHAKVDVLRDVLVNKGLVCILRHEKDDPVILETWI